MMRRRKMRFSVLVVVEPNGSVACPTSASASTTLVTGLTLPGFAHSLLSAFHSNHLTSTSQPESSDL